MAHRQCIFTFQIGQHAQHDRAAHLGAGRITAAILFQMRPPELFRLCMVTPHQQATLDAAGNAGTHQIMPAAQQIHLLQPVLTGDFIAIDKRHPAQQHAGIGFQRHFFPVLGLPHHLARHRIGLTVFPVQPMPFGMDQAHPGQPQRAWPLMRHWQQLLFDLLHQLTRATDIGLPQIPGQSQLFLQTADARLQHVLQCLQRILIDEEA